jgi:ApaG protein
MKDSNTNKYIISVETTYMPDYELQLPYKYFFTYQITIQNLSDQTGQLVSRHWEIKDGSGINEVVNGLGVVGQQPVIEPGESFTYTSGCPLISSIGKMEGYYLFLNLADNSTFKVQIPAFELIPNFALN